MRTKKAMKNIVASMLYQIISIICGLITPRLLLVSFGSTYNGVVSSATQFLSMISVLTLGIAGATRVALYKTLASNDALGTSRIMKATKNYMRKVACGVIIYACILIVIYPLISHNDLERWENSLLIGIVSIGTFADYFLGISNRTLLSADQSGYITYSINIVTTILNTALTALLIFMGGSIYIVKLGSAIVYLIMPMILNCYVTHKYQLTSDCEPDNTGIDQRGAVAFHSIANIVHNNTDLFVLTIFTDAKVISVYTVYYLVIGKIKSIMQVFTSGMEAAFGDMWAKNEIKQMKRNFRTYEYALFSFTMVFFSCVGILILPFIERYTRGVNDVNYVSISLAILFSIAEGFQCVRQPYLTLVQATGNYEATKKGAAIEAILNIGLSLVLVPLIGINGVILGTLVANLIRTTQYAWFVSKYILCRNVLEIIFRFLWLVVGCVIIVSMSFVVKKVGTFSSSWFGWIEEATIIFIISCMIALILSILFYRRDFQHLLKTFRKMVRH